MKISLETPRVKRLNQTRWSLKVYHQPLKFLYNNYKSQLINNVCSSVIALIDNYDSHNSINHTGEKDLLEVLKEDHGKSLKGKLADVILLDKNLFKIPPHKIHQAEVIMTIFNGRIVYSGKD